MKEKIINVNFTLLKIKAPLLLVIELVLLALLLTGCKTVYVPVETVRTDTVKIAHIVTDTVFHRDSVVKESLTTVMQLDSAAMAKYGVQLKSAERAWMVKTKEMERIIQELMAKSQAHDTIYKSKIDSVAVMREVAKPLTKSQRARLHLANVVLVLLGFAVLYGVWRFIYRLRDFGS